MKQLLQLTLFQLKDKIDMSFYRCCGSGLWCLIRLNHGWFYF